MPNEKLDDHTVQIGQWCFSVSGAIAYVSHIEHPGDIKVTAVGEGFAIEVFDDGVLEVKASLAVPYVDLRSEW